MRNEETFFSCMNDVIIMRNLDQATTQTIANLLWEHTNTAKRIGLIGVTNDRKSGSKLAIV